MNEISVLIGGKAGEGINSAGLIIARILSSRGYFVYMYYDYPSLIRGGHNFSIVRASGQKISSHNNPVDVILALDRTTLSRHEHRKKPSTLVIYNSDKNRDSEGTGIPAGAIVSEEGGDEIMTNMCMIGAFARALSVPWDDLREVIKRAVSHKTDLNLRIARRGYGAVVPSLELSGADSPPHPLFTGNEAIGLGLLSAGLEAYYSYPMTPSSGILHFLAGVKEQCSLLVVHPENEIAAVCMAAGSAYAGLRTAVGTAGGGFCLMTEALSMAAMTETPLLFVVAMRSGPGTGVPTYSSQSDLNFILHAGHGEFPRFVCAPADADQAAAWSARALKFAWRFQIPSFVLSDKTLGEGLYSLSSWDSGNYTFAEPVKKAVLGKYLRYSDSPDGVSSFASPPLRGASIKANSYAHDEGGITTEDADMISWCREKQMRKESALRDAVRLYGAVEVYGRGGTADYALLTWGSCTGACAEAASDTGIRVVQPVVLSPFPADECRKALEGVSGVICVEENYSGQLRSLAEQNGIRVKDLIHRYDGRPFTADEVSVKIQEVIR